jgi:hypothetical protein
MHSQPPSFLVALGVAYVLFLIGLIIAASHPSVPIGYVRRDSASVTPRAMKHIVRYRGDGTQAVFGE